MPSRTFRSPLRQIVNQQDQQARAEMQAEMLVIGNEWRTYNLRAVSDWKGKPRFQVRLTNRNNTLSVFVEPTGEFAQRWRWVDEGTEGPYKIRAKNPSGKLKFRAGYNPRTQPVAQAGVGDGRATGSWVQVQEVTHPGIEAREFTRDAENRFKPDFARRINNAIRRGIRRAR